MSTQNLESYQATDQHLVLNTGFAALDVATGVHETKKIRDQAEAIRRYAQNARMGLEFQNRAAELKLRAERKSGGILKSMKLHGGDRRSKSQDATLKDLGISKDESSRWQLAASVPEKDFEEWVLQTKAADEELTSVALRRLAKSLQTLQTKRNDAPAAPPRESCHLVAELRNHCETLESIVSPIYETNEPIAFKRVERRMLRRIIRELTRMLKRLETQVGKDEIKNLDMN